jgi:hypothetical protein
LKIKVQTYKNNHFKKKYTQIRRTWLTHENTVLGN